MPLETIQPGGYPPPTVLITATTANYPEPPSPFPTSTPDSYPIIPTGTPEATRPSLPISTTIVAEIYVPVVSGSELPSATPTPTATQTPEPPPTPTPTIDFSEVRAELEAQGQDLSFVKVGFHTGAGGNRTGLGDWMNRLDAAGVPFFLKSVDDSGPLVDAQQILRNSDVPHTLVFRRSGNEYDTPDYNLSPQEAARNHWQLHMDAFPPELDPDLVWLETINEVDKERSEWLAQFALETARLAMADGFRWAAFGWSSGEPEPINWQSPVMLEFLRLAANNPDRLAIAIHEYSFDADDIGHEYPFKVGRFQRLFEVADQQGFARPTVLITEWGWQYQEVPSVGDAMQDISWASDLYAAYPQVKGAAIWYLGGGFAGIAERTQRLIKPVTEFSLGNYFAVPLPPEQAPIEPERYQP